MLLLLLLLLLTIPFSKAIGSNKIDISSAIYEKHQSLKKKRKRKKKTKSVY